VAISFPQARQTRFPEARFPVAMRDLTEKTAQKHSRSYRRQIATLHFVPLAMTGEKRAKTVWRFKAFVCIASINRT
jgi:hypothetical protein